MEGICRTGTNKKLDKHPNTFPQGQKKKKHSLMFSMNKHGFRVESIHRRLFSVFSAHVK